MKPRNVDQERVLDGLGQLARDGFSNEVPELTHAAGKRELRAALSQLSEKPRAQRRPIFVGLAAAALLAATIAVVMLRPTAPEPLGFEVDPKVAQGPYLQPPMSGPPAQVRFTDGTRMLLEPGTRARIATTTTKGAELVLERGHAELHVVHKPGARWSFDAGPYRVAVTGTRFTVDWLADEERLEVVVTEGSVLVQAAGQQEGVGVIAGQRLVATARDRRFELAPIAGGNEPTPPAAQAPKPAMDPVRPLDSSQPASAAIEESWSKRVAAGDFSSVVKAAQAQGIDGVLGQAPLSDLVALADAARYTGNTTVAEGALRAQRNRFAASSQARAAAFLMGRIAEDQKHDSGSALIWYDTYLKESPQGAFAAEALGRRLVLLERTAGKAAAQSSAQRYLQRFPDGPYAHVAQQIIAAP